MATRRTTAERIADTREKIEQYENQMKFLLQQQKEKERRERTHRLIERGAILESLIDKAEALTNEQIQALLTAALSTETAIETLIAMQERNAPPPAADTERETGPTAEAERGNAAAPAQTVGNGAGKAV
jgi:hypothetical protein